MLNSTNVTSANDPNSLVFIVYEFKKPLNPITDNIILVNSKKCCSAHTKAKSLNFTSLKPISIFTTHSPGINKKNS